MPVERMLPSAEAEDLVALAHEIAESELKPIASQYEAESRFPREKFRLLGKSGLLGLPYPQRWGGGDVSYEVYLQVLEELAAAWMTVGVGLSVHCTPGTLAGLRVGEQARLATSLVVREDSLTLYGFADDDEKHLFELLQTASGVGPRLAQAVLAVHGPDTVRKAIANADLTTLTRVPGIGKKGGY